MHGRALGLAIAGLLVGAPAATAGWTQVDDPAPPRAGDIVTRALSIRVKGFLPYSDPQLIIRSAMRTRSYGPVEVLGSGEQPDGGAALLVREGAKLNERPGRLVLLRVRPDARVKRLWSRPGTSDAAMAVGPGGRIDVVRVGADRRVRHVAGGSRGLGAERRLGLRLRGSYITDVELALRGRELVLAATTPSRTHTAVFTRGGRVLSSQELRAGGRVELATAGSRVAAVVYDSGIEGEYGECVSDQGGVHLRAALLEPAARNFGAVQELDSSRAICEGRGHHVVAGADGTVAVLHHFEEEFLGPPQPTGVSISRPGRPFEASAALPAKQAAAAAVLDAGGALHVALFTADVPATGGGVLEARTIAIDGTLGAPTRLGRSSGAASATLDARGRPQIRFRDLTRGPRLATFS